METLGTHLAGTFAGARDIGIDVDVDKSMPSPTWQVAVDRAVRLCGSQAALARHLKVPRQHVSEARTGGRTIPTDRLPALGELVHMTPAELWTLQEIANMPRRNPFARECDGL